MKSNSHSRHLRFEQLELRSMFAADFSIESFRLALPRETPELHFDSVFSRNARSNPPPSGRPDQLRPPIANNARRDDGRVFNIQPPEASRQIIAAFERTPSRPLPFEVAPSTSPVLIVGSGTSSNNRGAVGSPTANTVAFVSLQRESTTLILGSGTCANDYMDKRCDG